MRADAARAAGLGVAVAALVGIPTLGPPLLGTSESAARYDTAVTPPDYAFAIWAPIFAGCLATAARVGRHATAGRPASAEDRALGWPLAGACALAAGWSVASQADRFALTPALLPPAAGFAALAFRRLQAVPGTGETIGSATAGLLLGWTALAAVVNLSAATQLRGADPTSRASVVGSTVAVAVTAAGVARTVRTASRGGRTLAAATVWGLVTTALDGRRTRSARAGTAVGAAVVLAAAVTRPQPRT
ncbi:hypothetical protein [uncultured Cellulomonas sp.]|uniref:hypothetical protein n=1 Tax=uncultured Cellulomonas sp. TaxID=189682 RepID=UPI002622912F|nr:hypothetical protein [uncultured Cellulomonas sp.]